MSLTHCRFLGKSQLLISLLLYLIKVPSDDAIKAIISTAVPTPLPSGDTGPTYLPAAAFPHVPSYGGSYHHADITFIAHVRAVEEGF